MRIKRGQGKTAKLSGLEITNMRQEEWLRSPVYTFVYSGCSIKIYSFNNYHYEPI